VVYVLEINNWMYLQRIFLEKFTGFGELRVLEPPWILEWSCIEGGEERGKLFADQKDFPD